MIRFEKYISFLLLSILLSSCVTRTPYQRDNGSGGYSEADQDEFVSVARFSGNAVTHPDDARIFSEFRAIEVCDNRRFKMTRFLSQKNLSTSQTVQKTYSNTTQNPTYFNGSAYSNYGTTYVNGSTSGGGSQTTSTSWNETYVYPTFDTYFSCLNDFYITGLELQPIAADQITEFIKDRLSGIQIAKVADFSPNNGLLQRGDIILKIDDKRVLTPLELIKAVNEAADKNSIKALIVRDGKNLTIKIQAIDKSSEIIESNKQVIERVCQAQEIKERLICNLNK